VKVRLLLLTILLSGFTVIGLLWSRQAVSPVNPASTETKIFVIPPGESIRGIAERLKHEGFIRDPLMFFLQVKKLGVETRIQAGDFRLAPAMTLSEVIDELQHGTLDKWVTIPEGWRTEEIGLKLAQELAISEQEFIGQAEEGYMFPDTYLFPLQASASAVVKIMRNNFDKKIDEELRAATAGQQLTLNDVVIIASLVEREARLEEDRPMVASVLHNRLAAGMKLDIDATLQYALGYQSEEKDWWKETLTAADKEIDSPYNTYKYAGLPPGPIANPGLSSIRAVVYPEQTDYFYYVADSEGKSHFARTLEEHQVNIQNYILDSR